MDLADPLMKGKGMTACQFHVDQYNNVGSVNGKWTD